MESSNHFVSSYNVWDHKLGLIAHIDIVTYWASDSVSGPSDCTWFVPGGFDNVLRQQIGEEK